MKWREFAARAEELSKPFRITDGKSFRLADFDPKATGSFSSKDKNDAKEALQIGIEALAELQELLYAQDQYALLLIFQAMDAAGKDGVIKHVMSGVNPQGCQVFSFKAPTNEELDHDYLWRCMKNLPERGRIGIFNRSYYEETLVVRVHPELLRKQKLPPALLSKQIWNERYEDIRNSEQYLSRNGIVVRKFFLHLSKKEQRKRFLSRLDTPEKHWKFAEADVRERAHWDDYQSAYEETIRNTASKHAPWYVIPADSKWFTRLIVACAIVDTMASLELEFPEVDSAQKNALQAARAQLEAENGA